jgi:hypothetical protein
MRFSSPGTEAGTTSESTAPTSWGQTWTPGSLFEEDNGTGKDALPLSPVEQEDVVQQTSLTGYVEKIEGEHIIVRLSAPDSKEEIRRVFNASLLSSVGIETEGQPIFVQVQRTSKVVRFAIGPLGQLQSTPEAELIPGFDYDALKNLNG